MPGDPSADGGLTPAASPDAPPDRPVAEVERLLHHAQQLEALHTEMVSNELDRLHELTTLTRIAEALSRRRGFDQVLHDCLDEVRRIVGHSDAWIVETTGDGPIGRIHQLPQPPQAAPPPDTPHPPMPRHVRSLCQRVYAHRPDHAPVIVEGDPDTSCLGLPIFTGKHLVGTLVVRDDERRLGSDPSRIRLIESVLRQAAMAAENDRLINALNHMIVEVVCAFSLAIESRDAYTGGHVQRVTAYALRLAQHAGLDERQQSIIRLGGLLHDIGKVAIPDAVLNKEGKLSDKEFALIRTHPVVGHQIIGQIPQLACVNDVIRHHHERWDGRGYPDRLAGQNIPLLARILAIADTFDAMTTNRSYRSAMSFDAAMKEIRNCAGTQFDAELAASFAHFSRDGLDDAYAALRQWCSSPDHRSTDSLMDLIDLDMPSMTKYGF